MSEAKINYEDLLRQLSAQKKQARKFKPHFEIADRDKALSAFEKLTEQEKKSRIEKIRQLISDAARKA